jgi:pimeloyl-ACP methyl ester carboxylesterase
MPQFGDPGQRIGYEVFPHAGNAPPLFLLHGFTASAASFMTNLPELSKHFTVVTVDLLGHGKSDAPEVLEPYTPGPAVERLVALMDHLGYVQVLVCGHSLGGAVGLRLALDHPSRVAGLVIINSNSAAGTPKWREEVQPRMVEMAERARAEGTDFLRESRLYPAKSQRIPPEPRAALVEHFDQLTAAGFAGTAEGLAAQVNAFERLPELSVPTLVVVGTRDAEFVKNAPRLIAELPGDIVRTVTIEGAGHAANLERADVFDAALLEFAREIGYLDAPGAKKNHRTLLLGLGAVFMVAGGGLLAAAALLSMGGKSSASSLPASAANPTATATTIAAVSGARTSPTAPAATASVAAVVASPVASATATPTATARPAATQPAAGGAAPVPTNTPLPTAQVTPSPSATATPSGPGVSISGPEGGKSGEPLRFIAVLRGPEPLTYHWSATGGASASPPNGQAFWKVVFPQPGCFTVSLTAVYSDGTDREASQVVSVDGGCK